MRIFGKMLLCVCMLGWFALGAPVQGQDKPKAKTRTPIAASVPAFEISAGYQYVSLNMPSESRVNLNGGDGNVVLNFSERWGATLDAGYSRTGNVLSTGHYGSVLSFLGGPVFYPVARGNARFFLHGMAGASRVDGAVPTSPTTVLRGQVTRPAYAIGAGVEYDTSRRFGVRGSADYLRTTFVDPADKLQGQNNFRVVVGLVFKLGIH